MTMVIFTSLSPLKHWNCMSIRDSRQAWMWTKLQLWHVIFWIMRWAPRAWYSLRAIEMSAIILARCTEGSIDRDQLVAKLQTCTLSSTTSTYMCHYSSVQSKVSWCKARGSGTALADPATAGAMAPEKPVLPDIISDILYSKISWLLHQIACLDGSKLSWGTARPPTLCVPMPRNYWSRRLGHEVLPELSPNPTQHPLKCAGALVTV